MRVDAFCSEKQYAAHVLPIWLALPDDLRGTFYAVATAHPWLQPRTQVVKSKPPPQSARPIIVASYQDSRMVRPRPYIWAEHGAGQRYPGDSRSASHPCYIGGKSHEAAILFLTPGEGGVRAWRCTYPGTPAVAIGCPKLEGYRRAPVGSESIVAVSWHAPIRMLPETQWAWPHFRSALPALAERFHVIGHAHPRAMPKLRRWYQRAGVEIVEDFADVVARASVYCIDNSSTAFEAMAMGIPVVLMNSPVYRRDVHHGLRFWDATQAAVTCDEPSAWGDAVAQALDDQLASERESFVSTVYAVRTGGAAIAAQAIGDVVGRHADQAV